MTIRWTLKSFAIKDLKPLDKNPRKLTKEQYHHLKLSLDKFGIIDKPIVTFDGNIIGGHQRIKILKGEGLQEVECWVPDQELSAKDIEELCIRLNKNVGEWDWDQLANTWNVDELKEWGFTDDELDFDEITNIENLEDDNDILEPGKDADAITKVGDVYILGEHVLVCGDSTLPDVVSRCLGDQEPILMVTDPPYGVNYDASWRGAAGKGQRAAGKVQNDDEVNWTLAWFLFPGNIAYVWHAGKYAADVQESLEEVDFEIVSQIIWKKQHFVLSRGDYHWQHEPCWYAVRKGHKHNWQGARDQSTVWDISNLNAFGTNKEDERTAHSTQKPLQCMAIPIKNNTIKGDGVYDPFAGSGTTLMAAEQLERKSFNIELSPAYSDIIILRWIKYRNKAGKDATIIRNKVKCEEFYGCNTKTS
jgi:DNA modification methylase